MTDAGSRGSGTLSGSVLKVIAIIAMFIDHLGACVFTHRIWLRWIGRLTFPIMAFFVYEGFKHTRDVKRYALRLGLFALVSEIPFDLAHAGRVVDWDMQNIGFTLLLGLGAIVFADRGGLWHFASLGCLLLGDLMRVDYGTLGVFTIFIFYLFRQMRLSPACAVGLSTLLFTMGEWPILLPYINGSDIATYRFIPPQTFALFSTPLLLLYNGKRGNAPGWLFYVFYPGHLLFLYFFGPAVLAAFPNF